MALLPRRRSVLPASPGAGLRTRIAIASVVAVVLVGALSSLAGGELLSLRARSVLERRASLLAVSTAARMEPLPARDRAALARELSQQLRGGITVVGPDRRVLPGAPAPPLGPGDPVLSEPHGRRTVTRRGHTRLVATERIATGDDAGTVVVDVPLAPGRGEVARLVLKLVVALATAGALGVAFSIVVARDIALDARAISGRARAMVGGEHVDVRSLPIRARDEVGRLVATFNRLQKRFAAQGELHREALARLEDAERRKESLMATLRHELRTPLNSILGFAELLLSGVDGALLPAQREDVSLIARSGAHLLRLVDDVFDLSAMASGRYPLARETVDLAALAREVVDEAEGIARTRAVQLSLEDGGPAEIQADRVALRRAVTNLVVNAIEHAGGSVVVSVSRRAQGFAVAVTDNGPGIPPQDLRRLFKPFERGRTAEARGAGLGLAITLALVELHGGTLSAHSEEGRGSTFTATLPAGPAPLPEGGGA